MKDYSNGPAPGFWRLWWNAGAFLPLLFLLSFGVLGVESARAFFAHRDFDAHGVETEAEVMFRWVMGQDVKGEGSELDLHSSENLYVVLRYRVGDREFREARNVSPAFFERSLPGSTHRVRYMPGDPSDLQFAIGETWDKVENTQWLVLLAGVASLATFVPTVVLAMAALRARRFGQVELARVGGVQTFTFRGLTMFTLAFCGADGRDHRSLSSMNRSRYASYPPGVEVEVYRGAKGRLWWVGDVGPRAAAPTVPDAGKSRS
ncbi:DUF3592 domain-containing protein [uncultured Tateyamaria sp.]|uniref:DUF3592 domain-containing protein n=1 Tax=uncultured Tateyamaria sp. TaxID=455651 RepID=UPI00260400D2|nr:DUF3592 domain-containing protein [uncultured Tateyamaria sp.]